MTNEIKNVPELRFPEFKEEWVEKKLGDITSKISDGIHSTPTYDSIVVIFTLSMEII